MRVLKYSVWGLFLALLFINQPSTSWAQQKSSGSGGAHSAGLQFGQVWPSGKIGEGVDGAIAPGLFYEYSASQIFALQVNAIRSSHNDKLSIFSTTAGIKANLVFYDQLVPYAFAGVGLYFVNKKIGTAAPYENVGTTHFGLNLGLGADLDLGPSFFMGLWMGLHNLFGAKANSSTGTVDISGRWSALFIRAGMRF